MAAMVMELVELMTSVLATPESMVTQLGLTQIALVEHALNPLHGLGLLRMPMMHTLWQSVRTKAFATASLESVCVSTIMMVLHAREQFALTYATMPVFASLKNNWRWRLPEHIAHHGMLKNMSDVFAILVAADWIAH